MPNLRTARRLLSVASEAFTVWQLVSNFLTWILGGGIVGALISYFQDLPWNVSVSLVISGALVGVLMLAIIFILKANKWLRDLQTNATTTSERPLGLREDVSQLIRFGMPEDAANLSNEVIFRIPISVVGGQSLERCDALLAKVSADGEDERYWYLMWDLPSGMEMQTTLDPGRGLYYVPVVRRSESEPEGWAWICDKSSYARSGDGGTNLIPPGHNGRYRLRLSFAGGDSYSYNIEINVPHKGVGNGKFYLRPLDWSYDGAVIERKRRS